MLGLDMAGLVRHPTSPVTVKGIRPAIGPIIELHW